MSNMNTIEYNEKLTAELDTLLAQKSATAFLADNALAARFVGAKTVLIPSVSTQALADYDRETGFVRGSVAVTNTPYTLSMDRGRSFQMDRMDGDESGVANLQGQVLAEFVRGEVVPEMDAYVLSKLAGMAMLHGNTVTGTPATEALKMLNKAILGAQQQVGPEEELVAFVNMGFWAALNSTTELTRYLSVTDFAKDGINTKVTRYNDVAIIPVPGNRMKTAFTFCDGVSDDQKQGGFRPASGAKDIGFVVLPRKAAKLVKKTEKTRTFSPEQNVDMDAWKTDYRVYYDLFVLSSYADTLWAYVDDGLDVVSVSEAVGENAALYNKTLADLQKNIIISDGAIAGELKFVEDYSAAGFEGTGHYLAVQANNVPTGATVKVKLIGGENQNYVTLLAEEDYSVVMKIADENTQALKMEISKSGMTTVVKTYRLNGLVRRAA